MLYKDSHLFGGRQSSLFGGRLDKKVGVEASPHLDDMSLTRAAHENRGHMGEWVPLTKGPCMMSYT